METRFTTLLKEFCVDLVGTFPELTPQITRAGSTTPDLFLGNWIGTLDILIKADESRLFSERKGFILAAVRLTPALWSEISNTTKSAIWKYLRTLVLDAVLEIGIDRLNEEVMTKLSELVEVCCLTDSDAFKQIGERFAPLLDSLKEKLKDFDLKGLGINFDDLSGLEIPEIPEHLKRGLIASLAESLAKQFDPAEFGINPDWLKEGTDPEVVFKSLLEMYKTNPDLLMNGAKRMAERIKAQILGGSLKREDLIAEAKEYYAIFKDHPTIKTLIEKFTKGKGLASLGGNIGELFKGLFGGSMDSDDEDTPEQHSGPSESDRLRATRARLRKKMEARKNNNKT